MSVKQFTYNKFEKLKSKKQLDLIFAKGKSFLVFPIKVVFHIDELVGESSNSGQSLSIQNLLKVGVGVSKRNFKKATDRNRIKRLLREAYRLNKHSLQHNATNNCNVTIFLMYIDKELPQLSFLEPKIIIILEKLSKLIHEATIKSIELPIDSTD